MRELKRGQCIEKKVYIAGVGPGSIDLVTPLAIRIIESCDVLIGGKRNLESFSYLKKDEVVIAGDLEAICTYISENIEKKKIAVLATGDPGIFSITGFLKRRLTEVDFEIIPGISALQYICSRMGTSWNDMDIISVHGREDENLPVLLRANNKIAVFTGGGKTPADICRCLIDNKVNAVVTVGERLSYPDERMVCGTPEEIAQISFDSLALMIVEHREKSDTSGIWENKTPGIPDHMFTRGDVPMTKEEIRAISISKLRLKEDSMVLDVGAGTGSVSIECGLICSKGKVYAVEKEKDAVDLIYENIIKFVTNNIIVVKGEAPSVLEGLPAPDRVFIGGSGGNMDEILEWIYKNTKEARVVVNAISPETVCEALDAFERIGFKDIEMVNLSVAKGVKAGQKHIMKALNPIYIISAVKDCMV